MKLIKGEAISSKNPTDSYVLVVKLYYGDADGYLDFKTPPVPNTEFDLEDLYTKLRMIALVKTAEDNGGGDREYDDIPGFKSVFPDWPEDQQYAEVSDGPEDFRYSAYDGHYVRYFDENGTEFQVTVED